MMRGLGHAAGRVLSSCFLLAVTVFTANAQPLTFTLYAGSSGGAGSSDGTGSIARFGFPYGLATDSVGNVYVADTENHTIRKITPAGNVTTLAGLASNPGSSDGQGGAARFNRPFGVATDGAGNVYVADTGNRTIRKVTPSGLVSTVAGASVFAAATDGDGVDDHFFSVMALTTDGAGNVYVADAGNQTIRKISPAGVVTNFAGSPGLSGDADGPVSAARFNGPEGVAADREGNVYVADTLNSTIRKITPAGAVTTLAGSAGKWGYADGTGSAARFQLPRKLAADNDGNVYVADSENQAVRKITPAGVVTTLAGSAAVVAGTEDGTGGAARFHEPFGVATDPNGNIYVADSFSHTIRKITGAGVVTTLAGSPAVFAAADGIAGAARFNTPSAVAPDGSGNLYVADLGNMTIRKITPARVVTTLAGSPGLPGDADGTGSAAQFHFAFPPALTTDAGGNIYVADGENSTIRKITPEGIVTTIAGSAGRYGSADGTAGGARFNTPQGLTADSSGNLYVGDSLNNTVRKITAAGVVTTLAGSPNISGSDDGSGSNAHFAYPEGVACASNGDLYVADSYNATIRMVTAAGVVTTFAGSAGLYGSEDGTGSAARFGAGFFSRGPSGLAIDQAGDVYVADTANATIRKITPAGVVTTIAGSARLFGSGDGTGRGKRFGFDPSFGGPYGVAVDSAGNIYVADTFNHSISIGRPALADAATIDSATGTMGTTRQLGTSPQTATSWQWRILRQPTGSVASLSSTSIRNPLFTPDLADVYVFELTASDGVKSSISTVSLTATEPHPGPRRRATEHRP